MDKNKNNNEIPENVRKMLDDTYKNILEGNVKQSKNKSKVQRNIIVGVTSVAASFALILGMCVYKPSIVDGVPVLSSLVDQIHYAIQNKELLKDNIEQVNKSCTSDGLNITVDNAMYDSNNILLDFTIESEKPFKESKYNGAINDLNGYETLSMYYPNFKINDKKHTAYSFEMPKVKFIDENTLKCSVVFEFGAISKIKDDILDFEMDFKLSSGDINQEKIYDGEWSFNFPIKSNKEDTKYVNINESKNGVTLNEVLVSPTAVTIEAKVSNEYYKKCNVMENIEVKEYNGNTLWATTSSKEDDIKGKNKIISQRYNLKEVGDDITSLEILFYGEWNEKTESTPIVAKFNVDLK